MSRHQRRKTNTEGSFSTEKLIRQIEDLLPPFGPCKVKLHYDMSEGNSVRVAEYELWLDLSWAKIKIIRYPSAYNLEVRLNDKLMNIVFYARFDCTNTRIVDLKRALDVACAGNIEFVGNEDVAGATVESNEQVFHDTDEEGLMMEEAETW